MGREKTSVASPDATETEASSGGSSGFFRSRLKRLFLLLSDLSARPVVVYVPTFFLWLLGPFASLQGLAVHDRHEGCQGVSRQRARSVFAVGFA